MIELIQTHEQINGGEEYLGFARQKLSVLNAARQATNLPIMRRVYEIGSARITVVSADSGNQIRIEAAPGGFICHPRDKTNPGGTLPGGVAITPAYIYPLVDDDLGSQVLTFEDQGWLVSTDVENYGNLDWIGGSESVVSWRGPAGRQFEMDSTKSYPGFTEWDYTQMVNGLEVENYTPYRNLVYQNGEVLKEFLLGYKVLGCAINGGGLVCVIGVDYAGITNPDGGAGGFYDEVWIGETRVGWQSSSRPKTPWFFNSSGMEAVCGNRKVVISEDFQSAAFSDLEHGSGSQINEYDGADRGVWGATRSGSWPIFRDYAGLLQQGVTLNISLDEGSILTGEGSEARADLPVMVSGTDEPTVTVTGPEAYAGEGAYNYSVEGNHCGIDHVTWSYPDGCGMGTVTATVTFTGGSSASGSMQVRMTTGYWQHVGGFGDPLGGVTDPANNQCIPSDSWPPNSMTYPPNQCISGNTKYVVLWRGCTLEGVRCWESFENVMTGCNISGAVSVPCWPAPSILVSPCCTGDYKYRTYWWVCYYEKYEWVCP